MRCSMRGVDGILLETFYDLDELLLALRLVRDRSDMTVICQFAAVGTGRSTPDCRSAKRSAGSKMPAPDAVGFNCESGPNGILRAIDALDGAVKLPLSVFPNAGGADYVDGRYTYAAGAGVFRRLRAAVRGPRRAADRRLLRHDARTCRGDRRRPGRLDAGRGGSGADGGGRTGFRAANPGERGTRAGGRRRSARAAETGRRSSSWSGSGPPSSSNWIRRGISTSSIHGRRQSAAGMRGRTPLRWPTIRSR